MKIANKSEISSRKVGQILGVKVDSTPKEELLRQIQEKLNRKRQFYIVTPNPEIVLQAQNDSKLMKALNEADFAVADGVGLRLAIPDLEIIKGRELVVDLLQMADKKGLKVYLLGSRKEVISGCLKKTKRELPSLKAKGNPGPWLDMEANPVSEVDTSLQSEIVKEINTFKPDLLIVGFGASKQEKWMYEWLSKLKVGGAIGVGGSLDYYSGAVKSVPKAMENLGLEWLWRLIQEPKRIGRIFKAVVIFPMRVILSGK